MDFPLDLIHMGSSKGTCGGQTSPSLVRNHQSQPVSEGFPGSGMLHELVNLLLTPEH